MEYVPLLGGVQMGKSHLQRGEGVPCREDLSRRYQTFPFSYHSFPSNSLQGTGGRTAVLSREDFRWWCENVASFLKEGCAVFPKRSGARPRIRPEDTRGVLGSKVAHVHAATNVSLPISHVSLRVLVWAGHRPNRTFGM